MNDDLPRLGYQADQALHRGKSNQGRLLFNIM